MYMFISLSIIKKQLHRLALVSIFFMCMVANAQELDSLTINVDSLNNIEVIEEEVTYSKFNTIINDDLKSVSRRSVDTASINKLKKDEAFWYINEAPKKEEKKPIKDYSIASWQNKTWLRNLLWVLVVGGFIAVLIWFLIASDVRLFRKSPAPIHNTEDNEELTTDNIFDIDYEMGIQKAILSNNYRMAIRLMYLQTLKELAIRNIIQYKQQRTNSEYLMQLFNTIYYKDFFRLTRNFEYSWYGKFEVTKPSFEVIKTEFSSFKQQMH